MIITKEIEELKSVRQWVCFQLVPQPTQADPNRVAKVPKDPNPRNDKVKPATGEPYNGFASSTDANTWGTYEEAEAAAKRFNLSGVGFVLTGGYIGIDLDHVIQDGKIQPFAAEIIKQMDSYAEISPSGTGIHIIAKTSDGTQYGRKVKDVVPGCDLEIYNTGRYFTMTGNVYGQPRQIQDRTTQVAALYKRYCEKPKTTPPQTVGTPGTDQTDDDIITKALNGRNGDRFGALWQGDTSAYGGDHSRATQALVNDLVYWTNGDAARVDSLFRRSGLYDTMKTERGGVKKWDVRHKQGKTYGEITIENALAGFTPWTPPTRSQQPGQPAKATQEEPQPAPEPYKPLYTADFEKEFAAYCERDFPRISTGVLSFDIALHGGLTDELYILGAETGQGKSAFSMYLAQNIAAQGFDVLYFALEMSRKELIARGISATSWKEKKRYGRPVTAGDILYFNYDFTIKDFVRVPFRSYAQAARQWFQEYGGRLIIIENDDQGITAKRIEAYAKAHAQATGRVPVVFVDYLQMLAADQTDRGQADRKTKTDVAVRILKNLSISLKTPVFSISSIGRQGYGKRITSSAFKESGDLEYTGGVLLGLNLAAQIKDYKTPEQAEQEIKKAINPGHGKPRKMILEVMKFRNGEKNNDVNLDYYAEYNYFEVDPLDGSALAGSWEEYKAGKERDPFAGFAEK